MITAIPIRMWMITDAMNNSMMMATAGEPRIWAAAAWLRPSSAIMMHIAVMVSGTLAIAVSRWCQKCSVPTWRRRGRARGRAACGYGWARSLSDSHREHDENPQHHGNRDRTDEIGRCQPFALLRAKTTAGVPDQVANAAEHVVDDAPGVAEQDQPAEPGAGEPLEPGIAVGTGHRDQPPDQQQHAEVIAESGDAMCNRHHHRQHRPVDLQVRGERPLGAGRLVERACFSHHNDPRRAPQARRQSDAA